MLRILDLAPSNYSVSWGASMDTCLAILQQSPTYLGQHEASIEISRDFGHGPSEVSLIFTRMEGLFAIENLLFRSGWVGVGLDSYAPAQGSKEYEDLFERFVSEQSFELGEPRFQGEFTDRGFPEDVATWKVAEWDLPAGIARITLDQADGADPCYIMALMLRPR